MSLAAPLGIRRIDSRDLAADVDALGALRRAAARNEGGQNDNAHEKRPQIRPTLHTRTLVSHGRRRLRLGKVPRVYSWDVPCRWTGPEFQSGAFAPEGAGVGLPSQSGSYVWRRHDQREAWRAHRAAFQNPQSCRGVCGRPFGNGPRWRPTDAGFSLVAQACHLRDLEIEGYSFRLRRLLEQDRPHLDGFDGARVAAERDYDAQNFDEALAAFRDARLANVAAVASLTEAQLARSGVFEDTKDVTVLDVLTMMRDHDEDHLRQLRDLRGALQARRR